MAHEQALTLVAFAGRVARITITATAAKRTHANQKPRSECTRSPTRAVRKLGWHLLGNTQPILGERRTKVRTAVVAADYRCALRTYANNGFTTFPSISVSRKSRP